MSSFLCHTPKKQLAQWKVYRALPGSTASKAIKKNPNNPFGPVVLGRLAKETVGETRKKVLCPESPLDSDGKNKQNKHTT